MMIELSLGALLLIMVLAILVGMLGISLLAGRIAKSR